MARPLSGTHVRLRRSTIASVKTQYPDVDADQLWRVEAVNGGYGREALHLVAVSGYHSQVAPDARMVVVWRGQVQGEPRCEYCLAEGHTNSTGTAATCTTREAEVEEQRKASSERMKAWNENKRATAEGAANERAARVPF